MATLNTPLQISNVFKPKIWGRRDLAPLFKMPGPRSERATAAALQTADELIGEVWITDDAGSFLNGPPAGLTLAEASQQYASELHGRSWPDRRFPLLAKYIFTSDWLSVQVHPDDAYARVHDPGNYGKCEMWYIISAERDAAILLGPKPGVSKQELKEGFERGKSRELLNSFRPQAGEAIFLPPGTVHALGPGLVLFEVEENSDLTYRMDDFGRLGLDGKPRPLHLGKGMDVLRPELPLYRRLPRLEFREPFGTRRYVLASRFFALEEWNVRNTAHLEASRERVEVLSMLEGEGRVENQAGWLGYRPGETWIIPPGAGRYRLVPLAKTRLLKFYVPDLNADFRRPLERRGARRDEVNRIVFD
jgi:mannose-6-phosphate isomerase